MIIAKKKIALIHPCVIVGGGSEAVILWAAEALKKEYDVTIITSSRVDFAKCNNFYGTKLRNREIQLIQVKPPFYLKSQKLFNSLRNFRLARYCKAQAIKYDLMFSTYNPIDFGKKGIQYILDPNFNEEMLHLLNPVPSIWKRWFYQKSLLRKLYLFLGKVLSNYNIEGIKRNVTIVDSDWAGKLTASYYGMKCYTIYPPVPGNHSLKPFKERENGFVCIGRIVRDKQLEQILKIFLRIRKEFSDVHLHILGKISDKSYYKRIFNLTKKYPDFIHLHGYVSARRKKEILNNNKYGIHGKKNEPFGIAVAEMIKAGCIAWVPDGGGQVEIVDHPGLIYKNEDDAETKIKKVLKNNNKQKELLNHLESQSKKFSVSVFMSEIKNIVNNFFEEDEDR